VQQHDFGRDLDASQMIKSRKSLGRR
jgi:hypothetical protein